MIVPHGFRACSGDPLNYRCFNLKLTKEIRQGLQRLCRALQWIELESDIDGFFEWSIRFSICKSSKSFVQLRNSSSGSQIAKVDHIVLGLASLLQLKRSVILFSPLQCVWF
jgi:hypothetical protein